MASILSLLQAAGRAVSSFRNDGWGNALTGVGTVADKQTRAEFMPGALLTFQQCSNLFHFDDIAYRVCSTVPEEMMRAGYDINVKNREDLKKIQKRATELQVDAVFLEAMTMANVYGGAAVILGINDFRSPLQEFDEDRVKSLDWIAAVDRRYLWPATYKGPLATAKDEGMAVGRPDIYYIHEPTVALTAQVHESRIIRFDGEPCDQEMRRFLSGWSLSALQRPFETLRMFALSFASLGAMIQDASQGVFKIKDLLHVISADQESLMQRLQLTEMGRSVAKSIIVDAEHEDFTRVNTSFTGLADVLDRVMMRLSAATRIPVTLLMGRSAAGSNATGDADFRAYFANVGSKRDRYLLPALTKMYRLVAIDLGMDPEDIEITLRPVEDISAAERALIEKTNADRDTAYVNMGAILPEQIALRLLSGKTAISDTPLDKEALEESLEASIELLKQGPPDPAAAMGALDPATGKPVVAAQQLGATGTPGHPLKPQETSSGGGKVVKGGSGTPGPDNKTDI